jgi:hypothetical protein
MATLQASKTRKATAPEIEEYRLKPYGHTKTLYPLAYWVQVGDVWCAVEVIKHLGTKMYEIVAPDESHFEEHGGDALHSLLCGSLDDVRERASFCTIVSCTEDCR